GKTLPPADTRYLKKGVPSKAEKSTDTSRQRVVSYLQSIYESVAETLPDVRDETCEFDSDAVMVDVPELVDPYVKAMSAPSESKSRVEQGVKLKPKPKVRTRKQSIELNTVRKHAQEDRRAFLSVGVPVQLTGIGGARAPHVFEMDRRESLGDLAVLFVIYGAADRFWQLPHHPNDVLIRTRHNMADDSYTYFGLYYPYAVAKVRLPLGLPAGIAPLNPITDEFKKDLAKHIPAMRNLGLNAAADYLLAWSNGSMPLEPLLEVRALGKPSGDRKAQNQVLHYVGCARKRIVLESAARAWARGVPWAEALKISRAAISKADAAAKALPKRRPRP
ncbi:unnamed protein product, partial [Durusdinium trenchii]